MRNPIPEVERRSEAVRLACGMLLANDVRVLPADPAEMIRQMGMTLMTTDEAAALPGGLPAGYRKGMNEALVLRLSGRYVIVYDSHVRNRDRVRFSVMHEIGHVLMRHFESRNADDPDEDEWRVMEDEANTFARNALCPPPVLDMVRGCPEDPRWPALFCMSESAWKVRLDTAERDRECLDRAMADRIRIQFREYMFGRICRECGKVFTDEARSGVCPECGGKHLYWNPQMKTRSESRLREYPAMVTAEDLKPRIGGPEPDLACYWRKILEEHSGGKA